MENGRNFRPESLGGRSRDKAGFSRAAVTDDDDSDAGAGAGDCTASWHRFDGFVRVEFAD